MVLDLAAKNQARTERMKEKRDAIRSQGADDTVTTPNEAVPETK